MCLISNKCVSSCISAISGDFTMEDKLACVSCILQTQQVDLTVRDAAGNTVMELAEQTGDTRLIQLLQKEQDRGTLSSQNH